MSKPDETRRRDFKIRIACTYSYLNLRLRLPRAIFTPRKQGLGQGNVFTGFCLFTGVGDVGFPACITGHMTGVCPTEGLDRSPLPPPRTRKAGSGHPTGIRVPALPGKPGKMRVYLENLEMSWNFEKINKYHGKMT